MGLEHSNVRESIMYPWYKGYFPNIELTRDDILGIQALYGEEKFKLRSFGMIESGSAIQDYLDYWDHRNQ